MPHAASWSDEVTDTETCYFVTAKHKPGHPETLSIPSERDRVRVAKARGASQSTKDSPFPQLQPTKYYAAFYIVHGLPHNFGRHAAYEGGTCQLRYGKTSSLRLDISLEPWKIGLQAAAPWAPLTPSWLLAKAIDNASQHAKIGIGENVSQIRQTLGMASQIFLTAVKLIKNLWRLQLDKSAEEAARLWLIYRYGILPLMGDMKTLLSEGLPFDDNVSSLIFAEGTAMRTQDIMDGSSFKPPSSWPLFEVTGNRTQGVTVRYAFSLNNPTLARMHALGLDPIGLAWELIPFSFVVDWFINIGQLLTSLTGQYMGMTFRFGGVTHFSKCQYEAQWIDLSNASGAPKRESGRGRSFQRVLLSNFPMPPIVVGGGFNFTHLVDGLALLLSRGSKR